MYSITLNHVGKQLELGQNAEKDLALAARCYSSGAAMAYSRAEVNIGFCFEHGLGVDQDLLKSRQFYERSINRKNCAGAAHYGLSLHFGLGFAEDLEGAADYYTFASGGKASVLSRNSFRCLRSVNKVRFQKRRIIERPAEPEKSRIPGQ
jgi:TPR repeat protein